MLDFYFLCSLCCSHRSLVPDDADSLVTYPPPPLLPSHPKVVMGGEADAADKFIPFTVIKDPSPDSPLMQVIGATGVMNTKLLQPNMAVGARAPSPVGGLYASRLP